MAKSIFCFFALFLFSTSFVSANETIYKEGKTNLGESSFNYTVFSANSNARRIEVVHTKNRYSGALAEMSFRERHLQIFAMVAVLMKESCLTGVSSLGDIHISRDPEREEDPDVSHPKFFIWKYVCK